MSAEAFLKQRAINLVVSGTYTLANWLTAEGKPRSFACRTNRISPFRMIVDVPVVGRVGDEISSHFGDLGTLQGQITDTVTGGFLLELRMAPTMRERLSNQLNWLEKKQKDAKITDARRQVRVLPANPHSVLTFGDGSIHTCFVIDMSVSGAAVSADVQPAVGTPLAVGACVGRVVRHLPQGFAVQFIEPQNRSDLDRRICRPVIAHSEKNAIHSHEVRRIVATPPIASPEEAEPPEDQAADDVFYL